MHPALVAIICNSTKKNGWGAIPAASYWSGCSVDSIWWDINTAPEKLYLFWQECMLLEELGELPGGAAESFRQMIMSFKILYPDDMMHSLGMWAKNGYASVVTKSYNRFYDSEADPFVTVAMMAFKDRSPELDRCFSKELQMQFDNLVHGKENTHLDKMRLRLALHGIRR